MKAKKKPMCDIYEIHEKEELPNKKLEENSNFLF